MQTEFFGGCRRGEQKDFLRKLKPQTDELLLPNPMIIKSERETKTPTITTTPHLLLLLNNNCVRFSQAFFQLLSFVCKEESKEDLKLQSQYNHVMLCYYFTVCCE